jgi:hypothetical protein
MMLYWLKERARDLVLWPLNLLRDYPRRARRLWGAWRRLAEVWRDGRGTPEFWAQLGAALHLLLVNLFDLHGGPELCQLIMHMGMHTSPLTPAERLLIRDILGDDWRLDEIRIAEGGVLDWIFQLNGGLAFATWMTIHLPRQGKHGRENLPILVHELTHVYQYQRVGSRYLTEAIYVLWRTQRRCYEYGGAAGLTAAQTAGRTFAEFNREQQAQIVQDYFARLQKGGDISPFAAFVQQCRLGAI